MRRIGAIPLVGALTLLVLAVSSSGSAHGVVSGYVVVFESARLGMRSQIYTAPPKRNQKPRRLPLPSSADQTSPSVSPRTNEVAVSSDEGARWQIYVVTSAGARIAIGSPERTNADPTWSPDGNRIAFESNHGGNWDIDVAAPDGSMLQRVTRSPRTDVDPSWSPDSSKIVFTRITQRGADIFVVNVATRAERRITRTIAPEFDPNWSTDGKLIVFDRLVGRDYDLWTMTSGGTKQRRLTHGPGNDVDPAWSPDGKSVAFQSDRTGNYDIFVVDFNGSNVFDVSNNPAALDVEPSWKRQATAAGAAASRVRGLSSGGYACTRASKTEHVGTKTLIYGTNDVDYLCGEPAQDVLFAAGGRDYVDGGNGRDKIYGGLDGDYILALDGTSDKLFGGRADYDDSKLDRAWMDRFKKGDVNVRVGGRKSIDLPEP